MAQISEKVTLIKELQQLVKQVTGIGNTNILKECAGLSAEIIPDGWNPSGPICEGFDFRVFIIISDSKDRWAQVIQKADDLVKKIRKDLNWQSTDKKIILKGSLESVLRIEDESELRMQVGVLLQDVSQEALS
jgi:hypothetical protein